MSHLNSVQDIVANKR